MLLSTARVIPRQTPRQARTKTVQDLRRKKTNRKNQHGVRKGHTFRDKDHNPKKTVQKRKEKMESH